MDPNESPHRRATDEHSHSREEIWQQVYRTESRVSAIEQQVSDIGTAVSRIEQHILNRPAFNVLGWTGVGITVLSLIGAALFAVVNYVTLMMDPVKQDIVKNESLIESRFEKLYDELDELEEFKHQTHYEFGVLHEWKNGRGTSERSP